MVTYRQKQLQTYWNLQLNSPGGYIPAVAHTKAYATTTQRINNKVGYFNPIERLFKLKQLRIEVLKVSKDSIYYNPHYYAIHNWISIIDEFLKELADGRFQSRGTSASYTKEFNWILKRRPADSFTRFKHFTLKIPSKTSLKFSTPQISCYTAELRATNTAKNTIPLLQNRFGR